jgi:hypothetical protein
VRGNPKHPVPRRGGVTPQPRRSQRAAKPGVASLQSTGSADRSAELATKPGGRSGKAGAPARDRTGVPDGGLPGVAATTCGDSQAGCHGRPAAVGRRGRTGPYKATAEIGPGRVGRRLPAGRQGAAHRPAGSRRRNRRWRTLRLLWPCVAALLSVAGAPDGGTKRSHRGAGRNEPGIASAM